MAKPNKKGQMLVAGIDFGTTFSGYAYAFKPKDENTFPTILVNTKWEGDTHLSQKTVTSILFDENKKFHSFGYPAETNYARRAKDKKHASWYFFKKFKMLLHDKKIHRDMTITAHNGKEMRAMTVFGESIKYMKTLLETLLGKRGKLVKKDQIHWVLTVPAIWTDSAKQFMRESAYEAGIDGGLLTIALEPEVASLFCQMQYQKQLEDEQPGDGLNIALPGTKFMVIDLGGGTADITCHKREADGSTSELHKPAGGHLGGTKLDQAFDQLLISLVGAPIFKKFSEEYPLDHLLLMSNFESAKRTFTEDSTDLYVTIPIKIAELYKDEHGEDIRTAIQESPYKDKVEWMDDKIIISAELMLQFFNDCSVKLVKLINELMSKSDVKDTGIFLMVGGFSESDIMQRAIEKAFPNVTVIVPEDTGLAVVKGAVIFGHRPISVTSRRAKYTYGMNISPPFDIASHPQHRRIHVGNVDRCRDVFKVYIHEGEEIKIGEKKPGKHISLKPNQEEMQLKLYVSKHPNPKFVDEDGSEFVGNVVVKLPKTGEKVKVEVSLMFGETEVSVEAKELVNNTIVTAYFDFL